MVYSPRPNASGDTLVASRDQIRTNFELINTIVAINHQTFGEPNPGKHKFVEMPNQGAIPGGLVASEGTIYTKQANGSSQLFYTNGSSGNEYQLTSANNANFATFSTNTLYSAGPPQLRGGWTFLPGALLLQYGLISNTTAATQTITFPRSFSLTPFSVTFSAIRSTGLTNVDVVYIIGGSVTSAQFDIAITATAITSGYWMAIGPA